ncbi:hypothetical protein BpHYR1_009063 [Brachionus plicatilis]|uniref:Uncharacterized protein n=1 Tax=Brachionus plicatilis TaxID=10195 RepID=A0A3M7QMS3_BRAPC|nr:hypothetical protein BpHYR1_009063 [Brachionus plicatilis]
MSVQVDGHVWVTLADRVNQHVGGLGLQETGHNVGACFDQLVGHVNIVVQVVFGASGVADIACVRNGRLYNAAGVVDRVHAHNQIGHIVQRVKYSEHVHAVLHGQLAELVDHIVRIVCVADGIGASEQHLEWYIGNQFSQLSQSFPRTLVQKSERHVECGAAPALQAVQIGKVIGNKRSYLLHRLVRVSECGVHEHQLVCRVCVVANGFGKGLGAISQVDISPSSGHFVGDLGHRRHDFGRLQIGAQLRQRAIDHHVRQIVEQLLGSVLGRLEVKQVRILIYERGVHRALQKLLVLQHI